jgi:hypothetical protein
MFTMPMEGTFDLDSSFGLEYSLPFGIVGVGGGV